MSINEKDATRIGVTELLGIIRAAQNEIVRRVNEFVNNPSTSAYTTQGKLSKIQALYSTIKSAWASYAAKAIPKQYDRVFNDFINSLPNPQDLPQIKTVEQIVLDTVARMNLAAENGYTQVQKIFMDSQAAVISDIEINRALSQGLTVSANPDNLKIVLRSELYKKLNGGKIITINGKNYDAAKYAELVARTRTREAQSAAAIDAIKSAGEDLVKVSRHNTVTPICQEYEGKIFSISGTHPIYPVLDRRAPYHPNCKHVLTAYIE